MSRTDRVVLLVGGVGGAKLAVGLANVLPPERLTIIVNTGDDFEHLGLYISPDLDTVMYSLAGIANTATGWGLAGDTFQAMDMVEQYGGPAWFRLGDRDLGTNLLRTALLRSGKPLSDVTGTLAQSLGVRHPLLPMSDDPVHTWLRTSRGEMGFQEYFVRDGWQPRVEKITFKGAKDARPAPLVIEALDSATLIVFGPSNPYLSVDPILSVPGIRDQIAASPAPCVAISPIIGGKALKGPAAKLMEELGVEVSPRSLANHYEGILDGIIIDTVDRHLCADLEGLGLKVAALNTVMHSLSNKTELATHLVAWVEENLA